MLEFIKATAKAKKVSSNFVLLGYLLSWELEILEGRPLFSWWYQGATHQLGFKRLTGLD
jgi:hypothetical protein